MGKIKQVINYRTSGTSLPSPSNMEFGELAIQYNSDVPKLIIKKADGTLAEFVDWNYALDIINEKAAAELAERETADKTLDDKITDAIASETARTESTYLKEHQSLDGYYTKSEVDEALSSKVDESDLEEAEEVVARALTDIDERLSGVNNLLGNKIDEPAQEGTNGQVLTTDGNGGRIWTTVQGGTSDYSDLTNKPSINSVTLTENKSAADLGLVSTSAQTLTDAQKEQARENIGAASEEEVAVEIVHFSEANDVIICDKTPAEIKALVSDGKNAVGLFSIDYNNSIVYAFSSTDAETVIFTSVMHDGKIEKLTGVIGGPWIKEELEPIFNPSLAYDGQVLQTDGEGGVKWDTVRYGYIRDLPAINAVTLSGNKSASDLGLVSTSAQTLTDAQKEQVRANIGAVGEEELNPVAFTGDYNDLNHTPITVYYPTDDPFDDMLNAYNSGNIVIAKVDASEEYRDCSFLLTQVTDVENGKIATFIASKNDGNGELINCYLRVYGARDDDSYIFDDMTFDDFQASVKPPKEVNFVITENSVSCDTNVSDIYSWASDGYDVIGREGGSIYRLFNATSQYRIPTTTIRCTFFAVGNGSVVYVIEGANDSWFMDEYSLEDMHDAIIEAALDSEVIHNTGNETVLGTKSFSDGIEAGTSSISSTDAMLSTPRCDFNVLGEDGIIEAVVDGNNPMSITASGVQINGSLLAGNTNVGTALSSKISEPASEGTNGQVLTTDGNGGRIWTTVQGGGGVTSGEVETMILSAIASETARTESTYLKSADLSDYTTKDDVNNSISAATSSLAPLAQLETHTGDTNIHVTTVEKSTWNGKQDTLVSGTNIKTVNGVSILGSGDITIGAGGTINIEPMSGITTVTEGSTIKIGLDSHITGSITASSLTNIPVNYRAVLVTVSADGTLSYAALPADGYEVHAIIHNTGSSVISVTLPNSSGYVCTSETTIYIAGGKYGEVNCLSIAGTGYVHGISSI